MPRTLTRDNLASEIQKYLTDLATLEVPKLPSEAIPLFTALKRGRVKRGNYPDLSLFEVANRVMSDLVVLASAERILGAGFPGLAGERPDAVQVCLGIEKGWDLEGSLGGRRRFAGECFNVAPSFFATKWGKSMKGLEGLKDVTHRVMAFNGDATEDRAKYERKSSTEWTYLLVDVGAFLDRWRK